MFSLLKRYRDVLFVVALLFYPLATYLSSGHRGRDPNLWIARCCGWPLRFRTR